MMLIGLLGGGAGVTKVSSDVADIRERVARIEARLDYAKATLRTASLESEEDR